MIITTSVNTSEFVDSCKKISRVASNVGVNYIKIFFEIDCEAYIETCDWQKLKVSSQFPPVLHVDRFSIGKINRGFWCVLSLQDIGSIISTSKIDTVDCIADVFGCTVNFVERRRIVCATSGYTISEMPKDTQVLFYGHQ